MKRNKNKKGFSFIEVILSIFILSTAMVAVLGLMTSNLRDSLDIIDQETAGFLAQEGVEIVRNFRDNNWKKGLPSFDSTYFPVTNSDNCRVDKNDSDIQACGSPFDNDKLFIDGNGYYVHTPLGGSTSTRFARKIDVTYFPVGSDNASAEYAEITSMVVWKKTEFESNTANCNTINRCAFVTLTLSTWGE